MGHTSDRYSSNGMCIACLGQQAAARKDVVRALRIKHNTARFAGLQPHSVNVRHSEKHIVGMLADILQYSSDSVKQNVEGFLQLIYESCPMPRALTKEDLLKFLDFDGWALRDYDKLDLVQATEEDPYVYVMHNGFKYKGDTIMEVLRNQRVSVLPTLTHDPIKLPVQDDTDSGSKRLRPTYL